MSPRTGRSPQRGPPAALVNELTSLVATSDGDTVDLIGLVARLSADALLAVPSFLGMSIVITVGEDLIAFRTFEEGPRPPDSGSSLLLSLAAPGGGTPPPDLAFILFAAAPGAFVDIAADVAWLDPSTTIVLDEHLAASPDSSAPLRLRELSTINQAVGVLIADGFTVDGAGVELHRLGSVRALGRVEAAASVLAGLHDRWPATP